jgi:3-phenylpropionate/trans-cinnamate dioxygenase ferredoxin reductase component
LWLGEDDRVLAGVNVNIWDRRDDIERLIRSRKHVDVERVRKR